jgi:hypothetical protein
MNWENNNDIIFKEDGGVKGSSPENKDYCQAIYSQNDLKKINKYNHISVLFLGL